MGVVAVWLEGVCRMGLAGESTFRTSLLGALPPAPIHRIPLKAKLVISSW